MDSRTGQAAFRMAFLILAVSLLILPFQRPNSAEFVVTILAGAVGLIFIGVVLAMNRLSSPPLPPRRARAGDKPVRTSFNDQNEDAGGTHQ
jgi:hypothetical protein